MCNKTSSYIYNYYKNVLQGMSGFSLFCQKQTWQNMVTFASLIEWLLYNILRYGNEFQLHN